MLDISFNHELPIIVGRLLLAVLLCGSIGFEREVNQHPAGFRTHLLVGVGSCLMMILSLYGFKPFLDEEHVQFDPARIPSYVISGIGFLGAGTILVKDSTVRGLTTAASIWVVAGLGLIIGAGLYSVSIVTTIIILVILIALNKFENLFLQRRKKEQLKIKVINKEHLASVIQIIDQYDGDITSVVFEREDSNGISISFTLQKKSQNDVIQQLFSMDYVENYTNL